MNLPHTRRSGTDNSRKAVSDCKPQIREIGRYRNIAARVALVLFQLMSCLREQLKRVMEGEFILFSGIGLVNYAR